VVYVANEINVAFQKLRRMSLAILIQCIRYYYPITTMPLVNARDDGGVYCFRQIDEE
jgi:hypothetical protein